MIEWFLNLSIKSKLLSITGSLIAMLLLMSGLSLFNTHQLANHVQMVGQQRLPAVRYANQLNGSLGNLRIKHYKFLLLDSLADKNT
jgi:hypothetical protein